MEMNLANKLTLARVVMIPLFLAVLLTNFLAPPMNRYVAVGIFILASVTDFLDGYIARSRNMVTNFGKFLDPLADKLLVSAAMISLVGLSQIPSWVVIIIISREFVITGFRLLAVEQNIVIAASMWGKLKTVTQMLMIIYLLFDFKGLIFEAIGAFLIGIATVFTVISGVDYVLKNIDVLKN